MKCALCRLGAAYTDAAIEEFLKFFFSSRSVDLSEIEAFWKNERVKKVFRTLFISMAGLFLARVVDSVTAQQIVGLIMGMKV